MENGRSSPKRRAGDRDKGTLEVENAAANGGIHAKDTYPAEFLYDNLQIQIALIDGAYRNGVKKLLFLGSSCIYPKHAPQPIPEEALLTGPLEPTNEWYAAGINDNYHPENSHALPALIRRFHEAKVREAPEVACWGSGLALREFLYADDLANACVFLMEHYSSSEIINIGSGTGLSIRDLAQLVSVAVGYQGEIRWDTTKPDGTPRKLMKSTRLYALGWKPQVCFEEGISRFSDAGREAVGGEFSEFSLQFSERQRAAGGGERM